MSCGVGHKCGSDPALLQLWYRPGAAALIRPLTWEPPYATGTALKKEKKKKIQPVKGNKPDTEGYIPHDKYKLIGTEGRPMIVFVRGRL